MKAPFQLGSGSGGYLRLPSYLRAPGRLVEEPLPELCGRGLPLRLAESLRRASLLRPVEL